MFNMDDTCEIYLSTDLCLYPERPQTLPEHQRGPVRVASLSGYRRESHRTQSSPTAIPRGAGVQCVSRRQCLRQYVQGESGGRHVR